MGRLTGPQFGGKHVPNLVLDFSDPPTVRGHYLPVGEKSVSPLGLCLSENTEKAGSLPSSFIYFWLLSLSASLSGLCPPLRASLEDEREAQSHGIYVWIRLRLFTDKVGTWDR